MNADEAAGEAADAATDDAAGEAAGDADDTGDGPADRPEDAAFYEDVAALLAPGDVDLHGAVVHTDLTADDESLLHQATLEVGDAVSAHVVGDPTETYVYSGNDDSEFGLNQHQGRTLDGDEFVWECQQPLRDGTFDVVLYWEATDEFGAVVEAIRDAGYEAVAITEDGPRFDL